ncbi:Short-chain dehydrogenase/reductase SAT3 [Lachnellula suecica]|uniref:Short-chain dehydrogenase/reductase SAT3 n=1 Tax=Lachnellula suecica TaxID=602035 RepID=A0A8T9C5E2_9HELO|nr:Short-chain dehydrogenase/reductase SAT3 [Lachnellula suecica]
MSNFDINNLFGVKGIVAIITGGGSGLGLYIAKALDANGAKAVYIIGRRKETLETAASQAINGTIIPLQGDATSKDSLSSLAARIQKEQGYINVLFANSGIIGVNASELGLPKDRKPTLKEFKEAHWAPSVEDFTNAFNVNVSGVFYTSLAFLELLDEGNKKGNVTQKSNIIVTSSIAGFSRTVAAGFPYSASKAATTHLVKVLATTLTPYKIRVNAIAPGLFPSEMTAQNPVFLKGDPTKEGGLDVGLCPLERTGTEEDVAGVALFMCSKGGAYLSGNVIVPDGGRLGQMPATY